MKNLSLTLLLSACLVGFSSPALAQFAKKENAIKYRQSALFIMKENFVRIAAMAQGKVPFSAEEAQKNAEVAAYMSQLPWAGFAPGTEGGKAKDTIWSEPAKFKQGAKNLETAMVNLVAATKTGDLDRVKAAVRSTGKTCKACHDNFRNK